MGITLVTENYLNVINLYEKAKDSGDWDEAFKIAMNNLPHKLDEVMNKRLERFLNPEVKKNSPPEIEDYEDTLKFCDGYMPEKTRELALEFYEYFRKAKTANDDALDVAREYLPDKLKEAVNTFFKDLMKEKNDYYAALALKSEFPDWIDYDINKLAIRAYEQLLKYYEYYSKKLSKNEFLKEYDYNYDLQINTLHSLNAINQNTEIDNYIVYEDNGVKIYHALNLELRIRDIDNKINKKIKRKQSYL